MSDNEQIGHGRDVTPPEPIEIQIDGRWWPGTLDRWALEADGWYGRAALDHGSAVSWYRSHNLRPREQSGQCERTGTASQPSPEIGSADS